MKRMQGRTGARVVAALAGALVLGLASSGSAAAAFGPIGSDFRISNVGTDGDASREAGIPNLAANPEANQYLVVYAADGLATDDEFEVFGQLESAGGTKVEPAFRISVTKQDGDPERDATRPSVAYNPTANEYLVVWRADGLATDNDFEIFGQRLSASGEKLGAEFRISTTGIDGETTREPFEPAVAYNSAANEYLVTWSADNLATEDEFEIFGQRLSAAGTELGTDFRISSAGNDGDPSREAQNSAIAYNSVANEYLVTWQADGLDVDGKFEIFGQRLSASGAELGGDFRISKTGADDDAARNSFEPAIAFNPTANEYLVTWSSGANGVEIAGQRIGASGAAIGSAFQISNVRALPGRNRAAFESAVAYNPNANEYLVTWSGTGLAAEREFEIFGQRLNASGAELGSDFRISTTGIDGDERREPALPEIAFNRAADEYLVIWRADGLATEGEREVFGHRVGGRDDQPPPSPKPPLPPSNSFKLLKLVVNKKLGTATLVLQVPGPGDVALSGKGLRTAKSAPKAAGELRLPVAATGKARATLAKRGALKLRAEVTYTPSGGSAATQTKSVRLTKTLRKPKRRRGAAARAS